MRALFAARSERDRELAEKWNRSLPFGDAMFDRWERAKQLGFGEGVSLYDSAIVLGSVEVGAHTWIGPNALLDGSGGKVSIGEYCSISAGVQIYTHDTVKWALSGGKHPRHVSPVSIGNHCYIGPLTILVAGTVVGDRCLIGAHSVVLENIPDGCFAVGSPARIIGRVDITSENEVLIHRNRVMSEER